MRRKVIGMLAVALGLGLAPAAMAADMPAKAPAMIQPIPYNWTGFYIGADIGGGWGKHDRSVVPPGFVNSYNSSGIIGGIHAGYNWQMQSIVLGLETDINWTSIKGDDGGAGGTTDETKVKWLGSTVARAGFAWDRFLVFAVGGWAYGGLDHSNAGPPVQTFSSTRSGWTVGGGAEYAINANWIARIQYRYYDLGTYQNLAPTNGVLPYQVGNKLSTVTAGISYKF